MLAVATACQGNSATTGPGSGSAGSSETPGWATTEPVPPKFGEPAGDLAARKFLDAASTGDKEGLMHVIPDPEACKVLPDFPECPRLQPAIASSLDQIRTTTAPYAEAALTKQEGKPPMEGAEVWVAHVDGKPDLIIIAFPANGRYFALARVADGK